MEVIKYYLFDFWEHESDPRISHLPLMNGGPWIAWSIIAAYVYFIKNLGPKLMKNREPYNLQWIIVPYNIFMIFVNAYFFYEIIVEFRFGIDINIWNFERDNRIEYTPKVMKVCYLSYLYLISKYLDLIETIFFVLRKKYNQISNLHVYHHSIVPVLVHMFIKVSPAGGPGAIFPLLNTFIHTIMYVYYTLSALGLRQYIWWKKYVTQLQLAQFIIFGIYGWLFLLNQKGYPRIFTILGIIQPVIFFAMFFSFYKRAYKSRKQQPQSSSNDNISENNNNNNNPKTTINDGLNRKSQPISSNGKQD